MARDADDLTALASVVELAFDADRAKARQLAEAVAQQTDRIARIDAQFEDLFTASAAAFDRHRLGMDTRWQTQLQLQRSEALYALAGLRAQQEEYLERLKLSFGQREAVHSLIKAQADEARTKTRRAEEGRFHHLIAMRGHGRGSENGD